MDLTHYQLAVACGDGLIARAEELVMYVRDAGPQAAALLSELRSAAAAQRPDQAIVKKLAGFAVGTAAREVPPFGVVAASADGLLVIVRGKVAAVVHDETQTHTLSGERSFTWVDEVFDGLVHSVAVGPAREPPPRPDPHTDLRAGVVRGGGLILQRRATGAVEEATMVGSAQPVTLAASRAVDATQVAQPAPPGAQTSGLPTVTGALVGEDGAVFPLDRRYVLGRDPMSDTGVQDSVATPIVVRDDPHVSRAHAHLWLDGGAVWIRDAGTPAGTFIAAPGASGWTQIGTSVTELPPEWSLRIGERIFRHQRGAAGRRGLT